MNSTYYQARDGGRFDATRLKLALFDPATVQDIIDLVTYRGQGLISDIFSNSTESDPPRILAVVGPDFIRYTDVPSVLLGLSTIMLAGLRKPVMGEDEYTELLQGAYGLPDMLARYYAKQIESYDSIIADADKSGDVGFVESLTKYKEMVEEGARRLINGLSSSIGMETAINWDQTQKYDIDMLDEFSSLGEIIAKLNRRNRLMSAQALLSATMNTFQIGDADDDTEDTAMDHMIGDVFGTLATRRLPPSIYGNMQSLALSGQLAASETGKQLLKHAGVTVHPVSKEVISGPSAHKKLGRKIAEILQSKTGSKIALGAMGAVPAALLAKLVIGKLGQGDPGAHNANLYGQVNNEYGPSIADAWVVGDVDRVVQHALEDADDMNIGDYSPEEIEEATGDISDQSGDIEDMSPEVGGPMTRFRLKRSIKKIARRKGKGIKRAGKMKLKQRQVLAREQARVAGIPEMEEATREQIPPTEINQDQYFQPSYDQEMEDEGPSDLMEETNELW